MDKCRHASFFSDEIVSLSPRLLLIMGLAVFFCWVQAKSFLEQNNINATSGDILLMESTARYGPVALAQTITGPLSVLIMCPIIKECQSLVCQSRFIRPFEKIRYYLQYAFFSSFFLTALMMFENIPLLFDTSIYSDNNRPSANLISLFNNNPIANLTPSTFAAISCFLTDTFLTILWETIVFIFLAFCKLPLFIAAFTTIFIFSIGTLFLRLSFLTGGFSFISGEAGLANLIFWGLSFVVSTFAFWPNKITQSKETKMSIKMENVSKTIKKTTVLSDVTLEFTNGLCYEISGENGSGKTMLLKIISGLVKPSGGSIMVNEKLIGKDFEFAPNMGLMLESPHFIDSYSGFKNLKLIASIKNIIEENDILCVLETVGLKEASDIRFKNYSLGMKQRLGIACAIMENPSILILDEPLNALDEEGVVMVRKVIDKFKQKNAIVIIANHGKNLLDSVVDKKIFIREHTTIIEGVSE